MKTAIRREMEAAGWRALGFVLGLSVLAFGVFFWGQHIEGRIDTVIIQRQHDHRTIHRLVVHDAQVSGTPNELQASPNLGVGSGGGSAPAHPGSNGGSAPGEGGSVPSPAPHHPSHGHPPTSPQPAAPTQPDQEQQQVGGGGSGESSGSTATPHESILESAGSTVGEVASGTGEVVGSATCGLTGPLLCVKP